MISSFVDHIYADSQMIALPGANICYVQRGAGPTVVLLHGVPMSLATWRHNLEALACSFTVVAMDMKGFGRSGKAHGDYRPEAHAQVLSELIAALRLDEVSLVASSYGCAPAVCFALAHPSRVRRLILINSVGGLGARHSLERMLRISFVTTLMKSLFSSRLFGYSLFRGRLRAAYADPRKLPAELTDAYLSFLQDGGADSFVSTLSQFDENRLADRLGEVTQPTLLIWGAEDSVLPVTCAHRIKQKIRKSRLAIVDACGHLPHEEDPDGVNRLLLSYLLEEQRVSLPMASDGIVEERVSC